MGKLSRAQSAARRRNAAGSRVFGIPTLTAGGGSLGEPTDTNAQFTDVEALERLERNRRQAERLLALAPRLSGSERSRVEEIQQSGFQKALGGAFNVLEFISRPGKLVGLAVRDFTQTDQRRGGKEIGLDNYLQVLTGDREGLKEDLGGRLVGEQSDLSGANLLDDVWETNEDSAWWNKALRFVASVGLDVVTDPLSYVTFGGSALSRKALINASDATLRRTTGEVAKSLLRQNTDDVVLGTAYGRALKEAGSRRANEIMQKKVDDLLKELGEDSVDDIADPIMRGFAKEDLWKESVEEAAESLRRTEIDKLAQILERRNFGELSDDWIDHVQTLRRGLPGGRKIASPAQLGGARLTVPFREASFGVAIPGTRGKGVAKALGKTAKKRTPDLYRRWSKFTDKMSQRFDFDKPLYKAAREGRYSATAHVAEKILEVQKQLDPRTLNAEVLSATRTLQSAAHKAGLSEDEFMSMASHLLNAAHKADTPTDIALKYGEEVASAFDGAWRSINEMISKVHSTLKELVPNIGKIENFVPFVWTDNFRDVLRELVDADLIPNIATATTEEIAQLATKLGVDVEDINIFMEVSMALSPTYRSAPELGASPHFNQRSLGITVIPLERSGETDMFLVNPILKVAYQSPQDVNDAVVRVARALAEEGKDTIVLPRKLSLDDLEAVNSNPAEALSSYLQGINRAAMERAMLNAAEEVGLAIPSVTITNVDKTLAEVASVLPQAENIVREIIENTDKAVVKLFGKVDEATEVSLGAGLKMKLPKAVVDNPKIQQELRRVREKVVRLERRKAELALQLKQESKRLQREFNLTPDQADSMVLLNSSALDDLRAAVHVELQSVSEEIERVSLHALGNMREALESTGDLADAVARTADDVARRGADQLKEMEIELTRKFIESKKRRAEIFTAFDADGQINMEATRQRLEALRQLVAERTTAMAPKYAAELRRQADELRAEIIREGGVAGEFPRLAQQINRLDEKIARLEENPVKGVLEFLSGASGQTSSIAHNNPLARLAQVASGALDIEDLTAADIAGLNLLVNSLTPWRGTFTIGRSGDRHTLDFLHEGAETLYDDGTRLSDLAAAARRGELDEAAMNGATLNEVQRYIRIEDTIKRARRRAARRSQDATNTIKDMSERFETWGKVARAIDESNGNALLDIMKPMKNGRRVESKAWKRLKDILDPADAAWLENRANLLAVLAGADSRTARQLIRNDRIWEGKIFEPFAENIDRIRQQEQKVVQEILDEGVENAEEIAELAQVFMDNISNLVDFARQADELGGGTRLIGQGLKNAEGQTFEEVQASLMRSLNDLNKKTNYKELKRLGDRLKDSTKTQRVPQGRMVPASNYGIAGHLIQSLDIDPNLGLMFQNMVDTMRAIHTPELIGEFQNATNQVVRWWKASATISRPSFHVRNLVGGVANGMLAGVGAKAYIEVGPSLSKFRKALARDGATIEDAIRAVPKKHQEMFREMWGRGVLSGGFSRAEQIASPLAKGNLNPLSSQNVLFRAGGHMMADIEDLLRAAVFWKWYDEGVDGSATFAHNMVSLVHFDYDALTQMERKIKAFVPFFVWSRRNIPLQLRAVMEQPGTVNFYSHIVENARENFGSDDPRFDALPFSAYSSGLQVGLGTAFNTETDSWSRLIFEPDLPIMSLNELPIFRTGEPGLVPFTNPINAGWVEFTMSLLGPQFTLFSDLTAQEGWSDTTAPVGLNGVMRLLNDAGIFNDTIQVSPQGDALIDRRIDTAINTAFPFLREFTAPFENDPSRAARVTLPEEDDRSLVDRARALVFATGGRGLGFKTQIPKDATTPAFDAQQFIRDLIAREQDQLR